MNIAATTAPMAKVTPLTPTLTALLVTILPDVVAGLTVLEETGTTTAVVTPPMTVKVTTGVVAALLEVPEAAGTEAALTAVVAFGAVLAPGTPLAGEPTALVPGAAEATDAGQIV